MGPVGKAYAALVAAGELKPDPDQARAVEAMDRFAARPVVMRVKLDDRWTDLSYQEVLGQVREASLGLQELGVQRAAAEMRLSRARRRLAEKMVGWSEVVQ